MGLRGNFASWLRACTEGRFISPSGKKRGRSTRCALTEKAKSYSLVLAEAALVIGLGFQKSGAASATWSGG